DSVVLPALREVGDRWQRGEMTVAQEHFATSLIRGRLLALGRNWGRGLGPLAVLACLPGERHDVALLAFGVALHARGWRIVYLGTDTPLDALEQACDALAPDLVAFCSVSPKRVQAVAPQLVKVARRHSVILGGAGFEKSTRRTFGAAQFGGGVVETAERLTRLAGS